MSIPKYSNLDSGMPKTTSNFDLEIHLEFELKNDVPKQAIPRRFQMPKTELKSDAVFSQCNIAPILLTFLTFLIPQKACQKARSFLLKTEVKKEGGLRVGNAQVSHF